MIRGFQSRSAVKIVSFIVFTTEMQKKHNNPKFLVDFKSIKRLGMNEAHRNRKEAGSLGQQFKCDNAQLSTPLTAKKYLQLIYWDS